VFFSGESVEMACKWQKIKWDVGVADLCLQAAIFSSTNEDDLKTCMYYQMYGVAADKCKELSYDDWDTSDQEHHERVLGKRVVPICCLRESTRKVRRYNDESDDSDEDE